MDKQQLIQVITENPQISYEDMKQQSTEAGVPLDLFEQAWANVHPKNKSYLMRFIVIFVLIALIIIVYLFTSGYFKVRERNYSSGLKTALDCLAIGEKVAKEFTEKYNLQNLGLGSGEFLSISATGKEKYCLVDFEDIANERVITISITEDKIKPDIYDNPSYGKKVDHVPIPTLIDSQEIMTKAKKHYESNSIDTGSDIHVVLRRLTYSDSDPKDNRFKWNIEIKDMDWKLKAELVLNAITGELLGINHFNLDGNLIRDTREYDTYSNKELGFQIDYPKGWKENTNIGVPNLEVIAFNGYDKIPYYYERPERCKDLEYTEALTIYKGQRFELSDNEDIKSYLQKQGSVVIKEISTQSGTIIYITGLKACTAKSYIGTLITEGGEQWQIRYDINHSDFERIFESFEFIE